MLEQALAGEAEERKRQVPTLAAFAPRFIEEYAVAERQKPSEITRKRSILRVHLIPALGRKHLDKITDADIQKLKARFRDHSSSSINNILTTLRKLLIVAVEWNVIERVPCKIRLLPRPKKEAAFWDFAEYEKLVDAALRVLKTRARWFRSRCDVAARLYPPVPEQVSTPCVFYRYVHTTWTPVAPRGTGAPRRPAEEQPLGWLGLALHD